MFVTLVGMTGNKQASSPGGGDCSEARRKWEVFRACLSRNSMRMTIAIVTGEGPNLGTGVIILGHSARILLLL